MKHFLAILALAASIQARGHGLRKLQDECPVPDDGVCPANYVPVTCGDNCTYSNDCLAELAGFVVDTNCSPAISECPVGDGACTFEYLPLICGDLGCEYGNNCTATLAGFDTATECSPAPQEGGDDCPVPAEGVCTMEYLPVLCGDLGCEYGNNCTATLAGFDTATQCSPALQEAGSPPEMASDDCPVPAEGVCTMEFMPVLCGDTDCEYGNNCTAGLAGFDTATQCSPAPQDGEAMATECPVPEEGPCTMELLPLVCGDNECMYDNKCLAELAGFVADTECTEATCPDPIEGPCTMEMLPVICGNLSCEYPNSCTAELAGFAVNTECTDKESGGEVTPEAPQTATDASKPATVSSTSAATTLGLAGSLMAASVTIFMA